MIWAVDVQAEYTAGYASDRAGLVRAARKLLFDAETMTDAQLEALLGGTAVVVTAHRAKALIPAAKADATATTP